MCYMRRYNGSLLDWRPSPTFSEYIKFSRCFWYGRYKLVDMDLHRPCLLLPLGLQISNSIVRPSHMSQVSNLAWSSSDTDCVPFSRRSPRCASGTRTPLSIICFLWIHESQHVEKRESHVLSILESVVSIPLQLPIPLSIIKYVYLFRKYLICLIIYIYIYIYIHAQ